MAVPGQTPTFPTPPTAVTAVPPELVRDVALSAPKDLATPNRTGSARFSRPFCSAIGEAVQQLAKSVKKIAAFMMTGWSFKLQGKSVGA